MVRRWIVLIPVLTAIGSGCTKVPDALRDNLWVITADGHGQQQNMVQFWREALRHGDDKCKQDSTIEVIRVKIVNVPADDAPGFARVSETRCDQMDSLDLYAP